MAEFTDAETDISICLLPLHRKIAELERMIDELGYDDEAAIAAAFTFAYEVVAPAAEGVWDEMFTIEEKFFTKYPEEHPFFKHLMEQLLTVAQMGEGRGLPSYTQGADAWAMLRFLEEALQQACAYPFNGIPKAVAS